MNFGIFYEIDSKASKFENNRKLTFNITQNK